MSLREALWEGVVITVYTIVSLIASGIDAVRDRLHLA